jgi:hypothetical protein
VQKRRATQSCGWGEQRTHRLRIGGRAGADLGQRGQKRRNGGRAAVPRADAEAGHGCARGLGQQRQQRGRDAAAAQQAAEQVGRPARARGAGLGNEAKILCFRACIAAC